ncbi:hypothetical protein [Amycolatopsis jiangsuensis]|uniref:Deazaflavin-dependent oxidoreductase (Nitroreductase family) n=1 Tax=Amycolatopsis jiangsuensis TaxID=1181879 RepID=A0A840IX47_9PSEU|nr:hypothetical protein [Amycolatopsis jiangsuensis]MBB4685782.1 hypothetical protein [Amycolatopsis jiangsuensis]
MTFLQNAARLVNRAMLPLAASSRWSRALGGRMTVVTYTGRKSGRVFSIPVTYRTTGDRFVIDIALPDQKTWWRNFTGDGGPLALKLDGSDRRGHGVTVRDSKGTRVEVLLDPAEG